MGHHELWFTELLNNYFAAPAQAVLNMVGVQAANPARPWVNFVAMEILVALIIVVLFAILRSRLSSINPANCSTLRTDLQLSERQQAEEIIGHHGPNTSLFPALCSSSFFFAT